MKTWRELDSVIIECSALEAVPAPNVSWVLPPGLTAEISLNISSHNGSDSATATLTLPACLPEEHRVLCQVDHPLFEDPESREVVLHACGMSRNDNWQTFSNIDAFTQSQASRESAVSLYSFCRFFLFRIIL